MEFYPRAKDAPTGYRTFYAFCADCDEEIIADSPLYYEADGDYDTEGRAVDCSLYLCRSCGLARQRQRWQSVMITLERVGYWAARLRLKAALLLRTWQRQRAEKRALRINPRLLNRWTITRAEEAAQRERGSKVLRVSKGGHHHNT